MRIVLINPSYFAPEKAESQRDKYFDIIRCGNMYFYPFEPPLGLGALTAYLKREGHYVRLIDMPGENITQEGLEKILLDISPDFVGITAMTPTIKMALNIAELSKKKLPDIPVGLGGVHPTVSPESVLLHEYVDFVIRGEGEKPLGTLCKRGFDNPEDIPGVCWKMSDKTAVIMEKAPLVVDLNKLPLPDYTAFPAERYISYTKELRGIKGLSMMVTRGCPYQCAFCAVKETMGRLWRSLDPKYAARLMMKLCNDYSLEGVWFKDSTFNIREDWISIFAETLIAEKNPYKFQINTRVDLVRRKEMLLLKQAGLVQVDLGIESGSPKSLMTLRKNISIAQIRSSVKLLKELGIKVSGFFMIGIPGETGEDIEKTMALLKELNLDSASTSIFTPLPGSVLYENLFNQGRISDDIASFESHHFTEATESFCDVPISRLKELYDKINSEFAGAL